MSEQILVQSQAAANLLSVSRSHFLSQVKLKKIPAGIKIGGRCRRWSVRALQKWCDDEVVKASNGGKV